MKLEETKILAVDIGSVRIGLAVWEPSSQLARCLPHRKRRKLAEDIIFFTDLIREQKIEAILVGLPLSLAGNKTSSTENALFWIDTFKKHFSVPVFEVDESFSSKEALSLLKNKSLSKKKELKDSLSAALFLEEFIKNRSS